MDTSDFFIKAMNKILYKIFSILLLIISLTTTAQNSFIVNAEQSIIHWKGFKISGNHYGTLLLKEGIFNFSNDYIIGGEFIIDMNTIKNVDIPSDDKYNKKLVDHLKNDDFFGVNNYPTAKFIITKTEIKGSKILIKGDLSIKNKTNPVEFLASISHDKKKVFFKSDSFKIDRSKWDLKYKSKSFFDSLGDNFIYDDMEISVEITALKLN